MFDLEQRLQEWRAELMQTGIRRPEVLAELEGHLREHTARLIQSGLPAGEAFQAAVRELGGRESLKREFSKLNRHWLWIYRDNPLALKILAGCFVVVGLTGLVQLHPAQPLALLGALFRLDSPLQILIGLGLLHRKNVWRFCAFGWSGFNLMLYAYALTPAPLNFVYALIEKHPLRNTPLLDASAQYASWLGLPLPPPSLPTAWLLELAASLAVSIWACFVLARPAVRKLFHRWV